MLAKFAEDDRIEYMNAQKRRMKQLEHQRAVERLLEERRDQLGKQRVSFYCSIDITHLKSNVILSGKYCNSSLLHYVKPLSIVTAVCNQSRLKKSGTSRD